MAYITTHAQRCWVAELLRSGLLAVNAKKRFFTGGRDPTQRRGEARQGQGFCRYLAKLEEQGVIEQWTIVAEDRNGDTQSFELVDPGQGVPLYIAGKNWDRFVAEADKLGLTVRRGAAEEP